MAAANPEVEFHMNGFLDECAGDVNNHYDSKFPNLTSPRGQSQSGW